MHFDTRKQEAWHLLQRMTDKQAAAHMKITPSAVRGMASKYRRATAPPPSSQNQLNLADTCFAQWQAFQKSAPKRICFAMWNDPHLPYQDDYAIELAARITHDWKPDFITTMSDVFDFPQFSTFQDKRAPFLKQWDNDLENALRANAAYVSIQQSATPDAVLVALPGNHDWRVFNWLRVHAPAVSEFTLHEFLKRITSQGVLWLGNHLLQNDALRLNLHLILQHGIYAHARLETTMQKTLDDYRYQCSVAFGHVHRVGRMQWRGLDHNVWAVSGGCLCKIDPHYHNRLENWHQGLVLGEYDRSGWHRLHDIEFSTRRGALTAYANGKEYKVRLSKSF